MNIRQRLTFHDSRYIHLLIALVTILVFYYIRCGLSIFNPTYINWVIDNTELSNGFFSFGFFRHEPWGFPLGNINNYFYPLGTNVFTCDIPLVSLLLKPFSSFLPEPFQYVGLWYLACHILQAWFAILLCEQLNLKGITKTLTVIFLLFTPVFMSRYVHPGLLCQWMILAALWIYFLDPNKVSVRRILLYQAILFIVSGLEFAYMWAMVFGFSVALFLRLWLIDKKLSFLRAFLSFMLPCVIMAGFWYLIGLFSFDNIPNYRAEGWGAFTFNLNSLFNPMGTGSVMPNLPYFIHQQLEGYNYLGAGVLLLIILCLVLLLASRIFMDIVPEKGKGLTVAGINIIPLLLFFTFSLVFSLSNHVSLNQKIIFQYPLPSALDGLTGAFRSSGRFFWPVYYFIIIATVYYFNLLRINVLAKKLIIAGCLAVQLYDIQYFLKPINVTYSETYIPPINNVVWDKLIKSFDVVFFYPGFRRNFLSFDDYRYFTYYSVMHHKKINMGYIPRFDAGKAAAVLNEVGAKIGIEGLDEQYLYISSEPSLNRLILTLTNQNAHCYKIDGYLVLFKNIPRTNELVKFLRESGINEMTPAITSKIGLTPWTGTPDLVTGDVKIGFYETDDSDEHLFMKGWVVPQFNGHSGNDSLYLILKSTKTIRNWISRDIYRFGTQDVADFFGNQEFSNSGFGVSLLKKNIPNGSYQMGLLFVSKENTKTLFWADHHINVNRPSKPVSYSTSINVKGGVRLDINQIGDHPDVVFIQAWAFPENGSCHSCKPYFILRSELASYSIEATPEPREDVISFFKDSTLTNTGMTVKFKKKDLRKGLYQIGILLKDTLRNLEYFSASTKSINLGLNEFAEPLILQGMPTGTDSIQQNVDKLDDHPDHFELEGWGFITNVPANGSQTFILLESKNKSYLLEPNMVLRPDVQDFFKYGYDITMSGYRVLIKKESIEPGEYKVCLLIKNFKSGAETVLRTDSIIRF